MTCKLTVYEENGQKRYTVLYADEKCEGYYLFREFTGPAELEQISGLTSPRWRNVSVKASTVLHSVEEREKMQ